VKNKWCCTSSPPVWLNDTNRDDVDFFYT
jgi:hypothetical protein